MSFEDNIKEWVSLDNEIKNLNETQLAELVDISKQDMTQMRDFAITIKKLQQSAKKLQKMGYYKYYFGDNNTPHVFKLRQYFYDKLTEERSHEQKQS